MGEEFLSKHAWNAFTAVNVKPLPWLRVIPSYKETLFRFRPKEHPGVYGYVALTIDDGLCSQESDRSLVQEMRELLKKHDAAATFFTVDDWFQEDAGRGLLEDGHEFGNHCCEDRQYIKDSEDDFEEQLLRANARLEGIMPEGEKVCWFRAPQGMYNKRMHKIVTRHGMRHALADAYCNDFAVSSAEWVADQLLRQTASGSIVLLHMPEKGHREWNLEALRLVLEGLAERNVKAVTLSRLAELAAQQDVQQSDALENWQMHVGDKRVCILTHHEQDNVDARFFASTEEADRCWRRLSRWKAHIMLGADGSALKRWGIMRGGRQDAMMEWFDARFQKNMEPQGTFSAKASAESRPPSACQPSSAGALSSYQVLVDL